MAHNGKEHDLWVLLRSCHCLTSAAKACDEEPDCLNLMGNKLYYDEGNEEIKVINGLGGEYFWNELSEEERTQLVDEYDYMKMVEYNHDNYVGVKESLLKAPYEKHHNNAISAIISHLASKEKPIMEVKQNIPIYFATPNRPGEFHEIKDVVLHRYTSVPKLVIICKDNAEFHQDCGLRENTKVLEMLLDEIIKKLADELKTLQ